MARLTESGARAAIASAVRAPAGRFRALTFDKRMAAGLFAALALLPLMSPLLGGGYLLHIGERVLIFAIAATSLELLIGAGGLVSFGHAAFLGIGAYAAGIAASHGLGTLVVALPAALVASACFALVTGAIAVRTHGVYFIMITLAFGQMAFFVAASLAPYGGDDGLSLPGRTLIFGTRVLENRIVFFYVTLALAAASFLLVSRLVASRFGRVLRGLTDSETRMQALGFAPYRYRLTAYVIAGTLCGLAGFLLGNQAEFVSPAYMHWQRSGELHCDGAARRHRHALRAGARCPDPAGAGGGAGAAHRALEGDPGAPAGAGGAVHQGRHRRRHRGLAPAHDDARRAAGRPAGTWARRPHARRAGCGGGDQWSDRTRAPCGGRGRGCLAAVAGGPAPTARASRGPGCTGCGSDGPQCRTGECARGVVARGDQWRRCGAGGARRAEPVGSARALEAAMSRAILELHGLVKSYGALRVTAGVDLEVLAGETHAIIGPNGAGKTTLVNQILWRHRP